jgi:hypothetical protein
MTGLDGKASSQNTHSTRQGVSAVFYALFDLLHIFPTCGMIFTWLI